MALRPRNRDSTHPTQPDDDQLSARSPLPARHRAALADGGAGASLLAKVTIISLCDAAGGHVPSRMFRHSSRWRAIERPAAQGGDGADDCESPDRWWRVHTAPGLARTRRQPTIGGEPNRLTERSWDRSIESERPSGIYRAAVNFDKPIPTPGVPLPSRPFPVADSGSRLNFAAPIADRRVGGSRNRLRLEGLVPTRSFGRDGCVGPRPCSS